MSQVPSGAAWLAAARPRPARHAADAAVAHETTVIHAISRHTYGVPRIHAELRRLGQQLPGWGLPACACSARQKRVTHVTEKGRNSS